LSGILRTRHIRSAQYPCSDVGKCLVHSLFGWNCFLCHADWCSMTIQLKVSKA
jgi:hypothetical protein